MKGLSAGEAGKKVPTRAYNWLNATLEMVDRPARRLVALNETGTQRIGEDHPRAKLTKAQVEQIRDEYEAHQSGHPQHVGYRLLATKWGVSQRTIRDICSYKTRNQWAARWKRL
jgi:hypothetical protein